MLVKDGCYSYRYLINMLQPNLQKLEVIKKDYPMVIKIFIEDYQKKLQAFMQIIQYDSLLLKNTRCCSCLYPFYFKLTHAREDKMKFLDARLYMMLESMSIEGRQRFFMTLFEYLEEVYNCHLIVMKSRRFVGHREFKGQMFRFLFKQQEQQGIIGLNINKIKLFINPNDGQETVPLHLTVLMDQIMLNKIALFQQFKMILIENSKSNLIIRLDLRNYYFLKELQNSSIYHFTLVGFDRIIVPSKISIRIDCKEISNINKFMELIESMTKLGCIQRLVNNIDVCTLLGKNQEKKKSQNLFKSVLGSSNDNFNSNDYNQIKEDKENQYFNVLDILFNDISPVKLRKEKTKIILKQKIIEEHKNLLIHILNELADRKQLQNQKIQQFFKRQDSSKIKPNFDSISKLINNKESIILPIQRDSHNNKQVIYPFLSDLANYQKLRITGNNPDQPVQDRKKYKDSFYQNESNVHKVSKEKAFNKKFYDQSNLNKSKEKQYKQSIYYKMYPQHYYKISRIQNIRNLQLVAISRRAQLLSEQTFEKQYEYSKSIYPQTYKQFKERWRAKIEDIKVLVRQEIKLVKICMPIESYRKLVAQALADVLSYSRWHPNVKECNIESVIQSQNSFIFNMVTQTHYNKGLTKARYLFHMFQVESKYYIALKYLPSTNQHTVLSFFKLFKEKYAEPKVNLKFLLIRISKGSLNGTSQLNIIIQYENNKAFNLKESSQYEFFMNFFLVKNYWKKSDGQINEQSQNRYKNEQKTFQNKSIKDPALPSLSSNPTSRKSSTFGLINDKQKIPTRQSNKRKCILNLEWMIKYDYIQQGKQQGLDEQKEDNFNRIKDEDFIRINDYNGNRINDYNVNRIKKVEILEKIQSASSLVDQSEFYDF